MTTSKTTRPTRVLIAEDDPDDRLMLQDAFDEACHQCRLQFVRDGVELLNCLTINPGTPLPDLVLLDLNMPLKDGRQALHEIRANPAFATLPVVVMTTSNSEDDRNDCLAEGANDYLVKPASYQALLSTVQALQSYWTPYD